MSGGWGKSAGVVATLAMLSASTPASAEPGPPERRRDAAKVPRAARAASRARPRKSPERRRRPARAAAGGFRLEGDPEISVVFGDSERFRSHVDAFFALRDDMQRARGAFSAHVRATMSTLEAHRRGRCPATAVAPFYARAADASREFRELGAELESHARAIGALHELGETASLTPDYRWKVNRARHLFKRLLVDYREMKTVFDDQLSAELSHRGCDLAALLDSGRAAPAPDVAVAASSFDPRRPVGRKRALPAGATPPVTYFVDNTRCAKTMRLVIDGTVEGDVAARRRAAFQAPPGRHSLCLIPRSSSDSCGDPGTVRTTFIHDGWSITVRCD